MLNLPERNSKNAGAQVRATGAFSPSFKEIDMNMRLSPATFRKTCLAGLAALLVPAALALAAMPDADFVELCGSGDAAKVAQALKDGAKAGAANSFGRTALMEAANAGDAEALRLLLAAGADANAKDEQGYTALMAAGGGGNAEVTKALLAAGADARAKAADGQTALMTAARGEAAGLLALLNSAAKEDVNAKDENGWTALVWAITGEGGDPATVAALLAAGADVNAGADAGYTPLLAAAESADLPVLRLLLAAGADVNAQNGDGATPLMLAAGENTLPVVEALLAAGADKGRKDKSGRDALAHARESAKEGLRNRVWMKRGKDLAQRPAEDKKIVELLQKGAAGTQGKP